MLSTNWFRNVLVLSLVAALSVTLQRVTRLRQSILQKAFTGEL
ncbi:MAG: hypothetical protein O3B01_29140 [Planctomycetota bacterium]|nr:hypothetical protein [Planctomycetota bacterium]